MKVGAWSTRNSGTQKDGLPSQFGDVPPLNRSCGDMHVKFGADSHDSILHVISLEWRLKLAVYKSVSPDLLKAASKSKFAFTVSLRSCNDIP